MKEHFYWRVTLITSQYLGFKKKLQLHNDVFTISRTMKVRIYGLLMMFVDIGN